MEGHALSKYLSVVTAWIRIVHVTANDTPRSWSLDFEPMKFSHVSKNFVILTYVIWHLTRSAPCKNRRLRWLSDMTELRRLEIHLWSGQYTQIKWSLRLHQAIQADSNKLLLLARSDSFYSQHTHSHCIPFESTHFPPFLFHYLLYSYVHLVNDSWNSRKYLQDDQKNINKKKIEPISNCVILKPLQETLDFFSYD